MWWLVAVIALILGAFVDILDKKWQPWMKSRNLHAFESAVILTLLIGFGYYLLRIYGMA